MNANFHLRTIANLLLLASCSRLGNRCAAEETIPLEEIDRYAEASYQARPAALSDAKKNLAELRKRRSKDNVGQLKNVEQRIAQLEDPYSPFYADHEYDLGTLGRVSTRAQIIQVISENEVLVELLKPAPTRYVSGKPLRMLEVRGSYFLENYPTKDMIDGRSYLIDGVFYMGTRRNQLANGGSRTIRMLRQVDLNPHIEKFTREKDERVWTMSDKSEIKAIFVRYEKGNVVLSIEKGKQTEAKLAQFSEIDQEHVRKLIKPPPVPTKARRGRSAAQLSDPR